MNGRRILDLEFVALFTGLIVVFLYFINFLGIFIRTGTGSAFLYFEILLALTPSLIFLAPGRLKKLTAGAAVIFYLVIGLLMFGTVLFVPWIAIAAAITIIYVRRSDRDALKLLAGSSFIFTFMIVISSLIRLDPGIPSHVLMFSIYADERPAGVPLLFYDGIVLQSPSMVFTLSLPTMLVYLVISIAISENYFWIVRLYSGKSGRFYSAMSGAGAVIGCQCESITAVMPSFAALLISTIAIPLLMESVVLVFLTSLTLYLLLNRRRGYIPVLSGKAKDRASSRIILFIFIIALPFVEIFGVMAGLVKNEVFFFGINFLMFIEGAVILILLVGMFGGGGHRSRSLLWIALSTFLFLLWFVPGLVTLAVGNASFFLLMNASSLVSGALIGAVYVPLKNNARIILLEYVSMMFSMTGIVLLYAASFNILVWNAFTLASQFYFAVILIIVTLPIMWYITNLSLVVHANWKTDTRTFLAN